MKVKVFYDPDTGQIKGWVNGFVENDKADGYGMTINGKEMSYVLLDQDDSLSSRILNPQDELGMDGLKFDPDKKQVRELDDNEKKAVKAAKDKAKKDAEDWRKANPPRDLLAEIDNLQQQLDQKADKVKPPKS
jgi:hypothetical protein